VFGANFEMKRKKKVLLYNKTKLDNNQLFRTDCALGAFRLFFSFSNTPVTTTPTIQHLASSFSFALQFSEFSGLFACQCKMAERKNKERLYLIMLTGIV